jgi:hypothetical protein
MNFTNIIFSMQYDMILLQVYTETKKHTTALLSLKTKKYGLLT